GQGRARGHFRGGARGERDAARGPPPPPRGWFFVPRPPGDMPRAAITSTDLGDTPGPAGLPPVLWAPIRCELVAVERYTFPFTAIVGQERMKLALVLNAINPIIGGVLIRGEK